MQKLILPIKDFKPTAGYKNYKYRKYWGFGHYGIDCASPSKNRALYGLGDGVVYAAGLDGLRGKTTGAGSGCGYCLIIIYKDCYNRKTQTTMDVACTYMHMAEMPKVKAGDKVTTKTLLGYYGNTGAKTSGPHLHIQFDTDVKYPLYCVGLSKKGHAMFKPWQYDTTVNPVELLNIGEGQSLNYTQSEWYNYFEFKAIEAKPAPQKLKQDEEITDGVIHITVK